jgi:CheY-like chemotaxis protein
VDDVLTNLDVVCGLMKPYNMQIDCVLSGKEAIQLITKGEPHYDAVFMDHMMPEMDGIEATRIIREEIGTDYARNIPIIALTANAIVGNEHMFLENGFQAFIAKPIDIIRLDAIINQYVRNKELEEKMATKKIPPSTMGDEISTIEPTASFIANSTVEGVNLEQGLERFAHDESAYLDVIRSFVKNTPPLIERMRGVSESNLSDFTVTVHGIKGSCYGICANAVGKMAEELENAGRNGDSHFVNGHIAPFFDALSKLLLNLAELLQQTESESDKTLLKEPDANMLAELGEACGHYNMDRIDEILSELDKNKYENGGDILRWIKEKIELAEFAEVSEKLSGDFDLEVPQAE